MNERALSSEVERELLVRELYGPDAVPEALDGRLLRTREVALLFQVSERAVTDWATKGRIPSVRTPGGHRRYPAHLVRQLLDEAGELAATDADLEAGGLGDGAVQW